MTIYFSSEIKLYNIFATVNIIAACVILLLLFFLQIVKLNTLSIFNAFDDSIYFSNSFFSATIYFWFILCFQSSLLLLLVICLHSQKKSTNTTTSYRFRDVPILKIFFVDNKNNHFVIWNMLYWNMSCLGYTSTGSWAMSKCIIFLMVGF